MHQNKSGAIGADVVGKVSDVNDSMNTIIKASSNDIGGFQDSFFFMQQDTDNSYFADRFEIEISRLVLYLSIPRYSLHPFLHSKTLNSIEILGQFCQMNEEQEERNQIVAFNTSSYCIYDHIRGGIEEREVK